MSEMIDYLFTSVGDVASSGFEGVNELASQAGKASNAAATAASVSFASVVSLESKLAAFSAALANKQSKIQDLQREADQRLEREEQARKDKEIEERAKYAREVETLKAQHETKFVAITIETEQKVLEKKEEHEKQLQEISDLLQSKMDLAIAEAEEFTELSKEELDREVEALRKKQEQELAELVESSKVQLQTINDTYQDKLHGADDFDRVKLNETALLEAAAGSANGLKQVLACLTEGADLEARGANACTALAISAVNGSTEIAELLIERGANKEAGNKNGSTPLHMCCVKGHLDIAALLLRKGGNVNAKNIFSKTPLYNAACEGDIRTASLLLDNGADLEVIAEFEMGSTALHGAVLFGQYDMVQLLVQRGANINAAQDWGGNSIDLADLLVELSTKAQIKGSEESNNEFYTSIKLDKARQISKFLLTASQAKSV